MVEFTAGEKVLCLYGPLIYDAKFLKKLVTKEKKVKYFVHYCGWSKNWDEWVSESRVLKYNETNLQRQKELKKAYLTQHVKSKKFKRENPNQ